MVEHVGMPVPSKNKGLIFDIQGHSVHDGPGTRTAVFFCGCPLHCGWCCNPEGMLQKPLARYMATRCTRCGNCVQSCPEGAVRFTDENGPEFDRMKCDQCLEMKCVSTCYSEGLIVSGRYYTVDELFKVFLRDQHFWSRRGGVTLTGGEPLMQRDFVMTLLKRMKESHFHVVVETTACLPEKHFMEAMRFVDWLFFDIKCIDMQRHKELTGVGNELILSNIQALGCSDWQGFPVARITIVPGVNDDPDNLLATAEFVHDIGFEAVNILPFHRLGESKYRQLGRSYSYADQTPPPSEHMLDIKKMIETTGLICYIGSNTPF